MYMYVHIINFMLIKTEEHKNNMHVHAAEPQIKYMHCGVIVERCPLWMVCMFISLVHNYY